MSPPPPHCAVSLFDLFFVPKHGDPKEACRLSLAAPLAPAPSTTTHTFLALCWPCVFFLAFFLVGNTKGKRPREKKDADKKRRHGVGRKRGRGCA